MRCFARTDRCRIPPPSPKKAATTNTTRNDDANNTHGHKQQQQPQPQPQDTSTPTPQRAAPPTQLEPIHARALASPPSSHTHHHHHHQHSRGRSRARSRIRTVRRAMRPYAVLALTLLLSAVLVYVAAALGVIRGASVADSIATFFAAVFAGAVAISRSRRLRRRASSLGRTLFRSPVPGGSPAYATGTLASPRSPRGSVSLAGSPRGRAGSITTQFQEAAAENGRDAAASPAPATTAPAASSDAASLLATPTEASLVREILAALRARPAEGLPDDDAVAEVQLLRFVREHGRSASKIEKLFRRALQFKSTKLPTEPPMDVLRVEGYRRFFSACDMPNGEWATRFCPIGVQCGFSLNGCPVKIERLGQYDLAGITKEKDYRSRLNKFYLGLVDTLQRRLDGSSVETETLVQTYEIFDLAGLSRSMLSFTALNFARDVLVAFATHYPSSFRKAVVINAPDFVGRAWGIVSAVLPQSVKSKVNIMGSNYHTVLEKELTDEALYWLSAPNEELIRAPLRAGDESESDESDDDDEAGG